MNSARTRPAPRPPPRRGRRSRRGSAAAAAPRLAPSAARTASSRRRATPRESSRLATLAQAMSSTSTTPASQHDQRRLDAAGRSSSAERPALRPGRPCRRAGRRPIGRARRAWPPSPSPRRARRSRRACRRAMAEKTWIFARRAGRARPAASRAGAVGVGKAKPGAGDADDLVSRSSRRSRVPMDVVAAAEALLPERVAEDDDAVAAVWPPRR